MESQPWWTLASAPGASPRRPLGGTMTNSRSSTHSSASIVPRHATTTSRLPSSAFPSSVATATYPIQLDSLHRLPLPDAPTNAVPRTAGADDVAYRNLVTRYAAAWPGSITRSKKCRLPNLDSPSGGDSFSWLNAS